MANKFIARIERNEKRTTAWLNIPPLIKPLSVRVPTPRPARAAASKSQQRLKRNNTRQKKRESARQQQLRREAAQRRVAEEAAIQRKKQQAYDARRRRYVKGIINAQVEEMKETLTNDFQERFEHMKENLEDLMDQKIKAIQRQPPVPRRKKKKRLPPPPRTRSRSKSVPPHADAASPPRPVPEPTPPVPKPTLPPPAPEPTLPPRAAEPTPFVSAPATTVAVPKKTPAVTMLATFAKSTPFPIPTPPVQNQNAAIPTPAPPMPMMMGVDQAQRMGTPVVQMGFPHQTPFVNRTVHSYPPQTTTVIHRRVPVRRKLWVSPSEDDDDVVLDNGLYEDMLHRDSRHRDRDRRRHKRRVKFALERLGSFHNSKRRRHSSDEYTLSL